MVRQSSPKKIKNPFGINWFTMVLFVVLAFVFIRKDLSLNFNLNAPLKVEKERPQNYQPPSQKISSPRKKKESKLTEKTPLKKEIAKETKKGTSLFNFFGNPFKKRKKGKDFLGKLNAVDQSIKEEYLQRFAHVAKSEQEKFQIPASIILANALLHSEGGQSNLSTDYNNHFSIPCGDDWEGGMGSSEGTCYRIYESAWMSFRNHSQYITAGKFANLVDLGATNYEGWAKGLAKKNFSKDKNLAKNLIRIIEQYGLSDLDK
ncbi:MAG: glucosaminidase domain-containing protein [Saprospiraceae bacterium]